MPVKFTAALLHEADKIRIIEIRNNLNLTEKDTMTAILDAAQLHMHEMEAAAEEKNKIEAIEKDIRRKAKYEEFKEAQKQARAIMAAGKVKKSDTIEAEMVEDDDDAEDDDSEPSID